MYLNEQFFCGQSQWNDGCLKVKDGNNLIILNKCPFLSL